MLPADCSSITRAIWHGLRQLRSGACDVIELYQPVRLNPDDGDEGAHTFQGGVEMKVTYDEDGLFAVYTRLWFAVFPPVIFDKGQVRLTAAWCRFGLALHSGHSVQVGYEKWSLAKTVVHAIEVISRKLGHYQRFQVDNTMVALVKLDPLDTDTRRRHRH